MTRWRSHGTAPHNGLHGQRVRPARRIGLIAGTAILLLLLACAIVPEWIAPYDPLKFDYRATCCNRRVGASVRHRQFRPRHPEPGDLGHRAIDLQIALFGTLFPAVFGTFVVAWSVISAAWPMRCSAGWWTCSITIPFLVLVIAIVAVLGPGLINMYIAGSAGGLDVLWRG